MRNVRFGGSPLTWKKRRVIGGRGAGELKRDKKEREGKEGEYREIIKGYKTGGNSVRMKRKPINVSDGSEK